MGEQPSSSGDDGTAAYTDALSEKHFLTLTAVLTNSKLEHDEKKLLVAEKCQQQQNQNGDLQSRLQQELRMPPLTLSPSKSVHAQHQGKKGRQLDLSTLFPWRGGSPLTFQLEQTEEDVPHQSECSKWLHQLRSNRGAASAGITLSEWRGAAEAKKERLLQLFFDQLKTVLQTFRKLSAGRLLKHEVVQRHLHWRIACTAKATHGPEDAAVLFRPSHVFFHHQVIWLSVSLAACVVPQT